MTDLRWYDRSRQADRVVRETRIYRFSLFGAAAFALKGLKITDDLVQAAFAQMSDMPRALREYYLSDPAFAIWLNRIAIQLRSASLDRAAVEKQIAQLQALFVRIEQRRTAKVGIPIGHTGILLQRFDLDPLVREVTPPTFNFDQTIAASQNHDPVSDTELRKFADLLAEAFANIRACDPDRYKSLTQLIRSIGYVPDGASRSCSAARYAGVVYLAGDEDCIVDLEESIVHEGAHQLLYDIGELTPLTELNAQKSEFELPWSGNRRDLFGYVHAYFIYLEVVKYYDKRAVYAGIYRKQAERIRHLIHRGLEMANRDISSAEGLTTAGRRLLEEMMLDTCLLRRDPAPALA